MYLVYLVFLCVSIGDDSTNALNVLQLSEHGIEDREVVLLSRYITYICDTRIPNCEPISSWGKRFASADEDCQVSACVPS